MEPSGARGAVCGTPAPLFMSAAGAVRLFAPRPLLPYSSTVRLFAPRLPPPYSSAGVAVMRR